uniref:Uncharacterized protein n=1 Tax=Nonomuraea gerenzanensis TaxID=93944 RepID=A0A1M4ENQ7_9ACTN|nr:hypothetical protein BN4615_P9997 [Nonomuraea gerenzanensis]
MRARLSGGPGSSARRCESGNRRLPCPLVADACRSPRCPSMSVWGSREPPRARAGRLRRRLSGPTTIPRHDAGHPGHPAPSFPSRERVPLAPPVVPARASPTALATVSSICALHGQAPPNRHSGRRATSCRPPPSVPPCTLRRAGTPRPARTHAALEPARRRDHAESRCRSAPARAARAESRSRNSPRQSGRR